MSSRKLKRITSEIKELENSIDILEQSGIYFYYNEDNITILYAMLVGPSNTPYENGFYFFKFEYPDNYPMQPPVAKYCTQGTLPNSADSKFCNIRFNPNLYKCGKVCVSILNTWRGEQWSACQTISTLLLTLCTLLCKSPLLNEPGVSKVHRDFDKYDRIIEYKNIEIAILGMYSKKPSIFCNDFAIFTPIINEQFLKNQAEILKFLEGKKNIKETVNTDMYSMRVFIDYDALLTAFRAVCNKSVQNQLQNSAKPA